MDRRSPRGVQGAPNGKTEINWEWTPWVSLEVSTALLASVPHHWGWVGGPSSDQEEALAAELRVTAQQKGEVGQGNRKIPCSWPKHRPRWQRARASTGDTSSMRQRDLKPTKKMQGTYEMWAELGEMGPQTLKWISFQPEGTNKIIFCVEKAWTIARLQRIFLYQQICSKFNVREILKISFLSHLSLWGYR